MDVFADHVAHSTSTGDVTDRFINIASLGGHSPPGLASLSQLNDHELIGVEERDQ